MVEKINVFILIIFLILFNNIFLIENLKGIYIISSIKNNNQLSEIYNSKITSNSYYSKKFTTKNFFDIIPLDSNLYYIVSKSSNKLLSLNYKNEIILINKNDEGNIYWNITKIKDDGYLIQNNNTKNYLEIVFNSPKCFRDIPNITNQSKYNNTLSNYLFKFIKIYEEAEIKSEHMKYIDEEPVDVVIKYIDLSDKTLNRTGIHQIFKDEDHEELRYSVRSVFENIPWFRKIIIVMPNDKVKYFKPIEEIKDRIVYIKDKDVIGFDTASIYCFHLYLWNLTNFNVSDNIILMDDDYFIGKPINKSSFFYYDEIQRKVLPNVVSDQYKILNKNYINDEYRKLLAKKDRIDPHTIDGWFLHSYASYKLLLDNYHEPLIDASFTHNALSVNIRYVKEIYDLVKEKYEFANELLYSKVRTVYDIQFQTFYNSYALNIKKSKVHIIPRKFIELKKLKTASLNYELFVINTSGESKYSNENFIYLKNVLKKKFNKAAPCEIINENIESNINNSKNSYSNDTDINSNEEKIINDNNKTTIIINENNLLDKINSKNDNNKDVEKIKKEIDDLKLENEYLKVLINDSLKSKNEKNNKRKNYNSLVIIIIVFIIFCIILIILLKLFKITISIKYSKNSSKKIKSKNIYISNYENERTRLN